MMVHVSATPQMLRPMIEAQIARDEAMAEAIAAFMESEQGRGRKVLVLCGAGHVAYGLGLPTRVRRRLPNIKDRIVLFSESGEVRLSPEEKAQSRAIEITHEQLRELASRLPTISGSSPWRVGPPIDPRVAYAHCLAAGHAAKHSLGRMRLPRALQEAGKESGEGFGVGWLRRASKTEGRQRQYRGP